MTQAERQLLAEILERLEDLSRAVGTVYDRGTKQWIWNDDTWKASDPHGYRLALRARAAMADRETVPS